MRCPNCKKLGYQLSESCPHCQFIWSAEASSDEVSVEATEELSRIIWLLAEVEGWNKSVTRESIKTDYTKRQKKLEITLGLRLPPFTAKEARQAWPRLIQAENLLEALHEWHTSDIVKQSVSQPLIDQTTDQINQLLEQLAGHKRFIYPKNNKDQLAIINLILETAEQLEYDQGFTSPEAQDLVLTPLIEEQAQLEIELGLRPEPTPVIEEPPIAKVSPQVDASPSEVETVQETIDLDEETIEPDPTPIEPPTPRIPFRERLWQTLLSERTLHAMLIMGIFLLFSAALSFVAWGWKDFSGPVRILIPTGFTTLFFGLGWYVRSKTPMYRSGIALSAIAALLIPIDFYTIYINVSIPPDFWPYFWFITSLSCLMAYTLATLVIRSRFFGYLVGVAAGSTVLAAIQIGHQVVGLSTDWRSTGLSLLALGLIIFATAVAPPGSVSPPTHRLAIFASPFRYLAMLTIGVLMPLTFGWRFAQRPGYDTLHYALTANWWLGSFIFGWGAIRYRSRGLGLLAAMSLPVATYLAQAAIFHQAGIHPAWHAFGWALLVPFYFMIGHKLVANSDPILHSHGRSAIGWGTVLLLVSAFWSLTDLSNGAAAASSHAILAGAVILAALLWQQPLYLYGSSMLAFSATSFAMIANIENLTLAQLSIGWATLAIAHIMLALNLGTRFPILVPNFARPLAVSGYLIATIAMLPPLLSYSGWTLTYTLGNWLALTTWGARLAHLKHPGFINKGIWRKPVFHWFTVLAWPVWLSVLHNTIQLPNAALPLMLAALAWAMLLLSYRLNRISSAYRYPWALTGGFLSVVAPMLAFMLVPDGFVPGITLLAAGLLYFVDALTQRQSGEFVPAGLVTAWGYLLVLNQTTLSAGAIGLALTGLISVYLVSGLSLEYKNSTKYPTHFLAPLYATSHLLTFFLLVWLYGTALSYPWWIITSGVWGALSQFLLAGVYGLYAWSKYKERWAHLVAWLIALGWTFIAVIYTPGNGSVMAALAMIVIAFILVERGLHHLIRTKFGSIRQQAYLRLIWRLFKRPLWGVGWSGSALVIGLTLLHNLVTLRASTIAEIWAVVALLLITALYALSARLFKLARFIWLSALLSIVPWTLLAHLGWFTPYRPSLAIYTLSWVSLAWLLFITSVSLTRRNLTAYALPAKVVSQGLLVLVIGLATLASTASLGLSVALLSTGALYFAYAIFYRQAWALAPAVLVTGWGYLVWFRSFALLADILGFALSLLVLVLILSGLWVERKRSSVYTRRFLSPLYLTSHLLTLSVLAQIYVRPIDNLFFGLAWTDSMRLWAAAGQLVLGLTYGLYTWGSYKERWGHVAAWLLTFSGTFVAITLSSGSGSSAAKAALGAIAFILTERGLHWWRQQRTGSRRKQAYLRLTWWLYRRPLLVTGWVISAVTIGLALMRNLMILGGGYTREFWAAMALFLIVGLYALSARLFRKAHFLWLAAPLSFVPWTILSHLGWFTWYRPTLPGYALSWIILAWILLLVSLLVARQASWAYVFPLKLTAHMLMPLALLWGIVDVSTSRITLGLAVIFYSLEAILSHRVLKRSGTNATWWHTKYLYPAVSLVPIWGIYLMAWLWPLAQREHYGLMFLLFSPVSLGIGHWLYTIAPNAGRRYGLPGYIGTFVWLGIGTLLVGYQANYLAAALCFAAVMMVIATWYFKQAVWLYVGASLAPVSLLITLNEAGVPLNRFGWWLIGLGSIYLLTAWILERTKLPIYKTTMLITGFVVISLALPPSSLDQTGALVGYGSVALLYAICAFWLKQPLFLTPATGLMLVPYGVALQNSALAPRYYGTALFPGAVLALGLGWLLDRQFGAFTNFPWARKSQWYVALVDRLFEWYALPLYTVGLALAIITPLFAQNYSSLVALNFLLMMPLLGWALYRFRLRVWLVALAVAGHFAALFYLGALGWWSQRDMAEAWLRFLPVTLIMVLATLFIQHYRQETSPLAKKRSLNSWSYPLYIIIVFDISISQFLSLSSIESIAAATITLVHFILLTGLTSLWRSRGTAYVSLSFGMIAIVQWLSLIDNRIEGLPVTLAFLALMYGFGGYGLALIRSHLEQSQELRTWLTVWEIPLQRFSLGLSFVTLSLTFVLGIDIIGWTIKAMFGLPYQHLVNTVDIRMAIGVFGFLGLLYVIVSITHQWARLGYLAIGMLLTAWFLQVFYIQQWSNIERMQWYIIPIGLYLLGISYIEWQHGHKTFARRLDYLAIALMMVMLFWQTLSFGWGFALLLGTEGLAAFFWGSARRLRRFLYAGMIGVLLATIGQLLNSWNSINQWIVFGIVGLSLVLIAIAVERKLEDIKTWYDVLETWE